MLINIVYLLGAGRSGTTLIASVLNTNRSVQTVGELHQFPEYLYENKNCSCGEALQQCSFWSKVLSYLKKNNFSCTHEDIFFYDTKERHSKIPKLLLSPSSNIKYDNFQEQTFASIQATSDKKWILDSSKYISRFLMLNSNKRFNTKGVFVVRDVRGVVYSFSKKVQTTRNPLNAIIYYSLINYIGEFVCLINKNIIKIKYEEFVKNPELQSKRILSHLGDNENSGQINLDSITMPHIVGGNRMKKNKSIKISFDEKWKKGISRPKQVLYYFLALPLMAVNRYKL